MSKQLDFKKKHLNEQTREKAEQMLTEMFPDHDEDEELDEDEECLLGPKASMETMIQRLAEMMTPIDQQNQKN